MQSGLTSFLSSFLTLYTVCNRRQAVFLLSLIFDYISERIIKRSLKHIYFKLPGPSGETRTRGLMLPKHARYQLRYTRKCLSIITQKDSHCK